MFPPSGRVGVALSGGADSVCLLHVLREIRHHWNLRLTALHLNHLLRGEEADSDEQFAHELCDSWGIAFVSTRVDVRAAAAGVNLEQAARDARRRFFADQIASGAVDRIAVAHTRSDQAETVLFRLLRGAYTTGLAGMRPVSSIGIVRPLLDVDREEVEQYLKDRGIEWREDSSNRELRFARNRIRHQLLPSLAEHWNPQLGRSLAHHATLAQEDEDYWRDETNPIADQLLTPGDGGSLVLNVERLHELPKALARRILRCAVERIRGDLRRIDFTHLDKLARLTDCSEGHNRVQLPGVDVLRSFEWVRFARPAEIPPDRDFAAEVDPPGVVPLPGTSVQLSLELIERQLENPRDTLGAELDWSRIRSEMAAPGSQPGTRLVIRNWRPGDAYQRAGDQRPYKLKELFQAARVPLWERRSWPVLAAGARIVWSRRFGPARDFAADSSSRMVLRVTERT